MCFRILLIGETPLAYAISGAYIATVKYLLDHGADPDKVDDKGFTSLHIAAEEGLSPTLFISLFVYCTEISFPCFGETCIMKIIIDHGMFSGILCEW